MFKTNFLNRRFLFTLALFLFLIFLGNINFLEAANNGSPLGNSSAVNVSDKGVTLIQNYTLDGESLVGDGESANFSTFLRMIVKLAMGGAGVLAVVLLIMGGVQYTTVDTFTGKQKGKETLTNAILGLLLVFAAFFVLQAINPRLLNDQVSLTNVKTKTCGMIESTSEKGLNDWLSSAKHKDWQYGGGPYFNTEQVDDGVNCTPDLQTCLDQEANFEKANADLTDGDDGFFYHACLDCNGDTCTEKKDGTATGQVFLFYCESYKIDISVLLPDFKVDCGFSIPNNPEEQEYSNLINSGYKEVDYTCIYASSEAKEACEKTFKTAIEDIMDDSDGGNYQQECKIVTKRQGKVNSTLVILCLPKNS